MNNKGQSLIEVVVALGVSMVIVTAIVIAVVLAVANTQIAKTQNLATFYARQGMEILRQASRADWKAFKEYNGSYCFAKDAAKLTDLNQKLEDYCIEDSNNFRREVIIISPDVFISNECKIANTNTYGSNVSVIVSWSDSKCATLMVSCHQVRLDSCFQNLNAIPTP